MTLSESVFIDRSHKIFKKFVHLFSAHLVREGLQTVFFLYLARRFMPMYSEVMTALHLGQFLLVMAEGGINRHLATLLGRKADYPTTILLQVTLVKSVLIVLCWLVMVGSVFALEYSPELKALAVIIGAGVVLEAVASSFYIACQVLGRQDVEGRWRILGAVLGFGWGIGALLLGAPPIVVAFFKLIETIIPLAATGYITLRRARRATLPSLRQFWATWQGGIIFTAIEITATAYNKANLILLPKYASMDLVAQYNATWMLVDGVATMISGMLLGKVLYPLFIKLWTTNQDEFTRLARDSARFLLAASIPVMFVLAVESDRIIALLFGPHFQEAATLQKLLVATVVCGFIHNLAAFLMMSVGQVRLLLVFTLIGLVFNLGACLWLIPGNPLEGAALAIVLTKGLVTLFTVSFCQVRLGLIPGKSFLHLLLVIALGYGLYWLGSTFLLREVGEILALGPILALIWLWKKEIGRNKAVALAEAAAANSET